MTTRQSLNAPAEGTKNDKDMPLQCWIVLYKSCLMRQWKVHITWLFGSCWGSKLCLRHNFSCEWQNLDPYRKTIRAPIGTESIPADTSYIGLFNPVIAPSCHLWIAVPVPPNFVRLSFFVCQNLCLSINVDDIYRQSQIKYDIPQTYPWHYTNIFWHCLIQPVWHNTYSIVSALYRSTVHLFLRTSTYGKSAFVPLLATAPKT